MSRKLEDLTSYDADIFLVSDIPVMMPLNVTPLWSARSGYDAAGVRSLQEARVELPTLTPEEFDIVQSVCQGRTNQEIAERMSISERTVGYRLDHIYETFGLSNRMELVMLLRPSRFRKPQKPN